MKKFLSILLALTLLMGTLVCIPAYAADEVIEEGTEGEVTEEPGKLDEIIGDITNMENFQNAVINSSSGFVFPEDGEEDINKMIAGGLIEGEMLGLSVDYLYNGTGELFWKNVTVSKDDITLAKANLNTYLKRVLNEKYGGFNLYTMENNAASINATKIANFLGHMFYPDFRDVTIQFEGNETIREDQFYETILEKSGFADVLQYNWCNQGRFDFRPVLQTWGLNLGNVLESEYKDGMRLGKKLLPAVINKFMSEGPVNAALDIINTYSKSYLFYLYDATVALFTQKISAGIIDPTDLETMDGLLNLVVNNNNPDDTSKLQFVTLPTKRFKASKDTTELFLYIILYSNINCRYKNNEAVVEGYKGEDARVNSMIDVLLKGDITEFVLDLSNLFAENITQTPNDIFSSLKNTISKFIQKIADILDQWFKILTGEAQFPKP